MKQKDVALIIIVAFISGVLSLFASKALFSSSIGKQKAEVVQQISTDFPAPDSTYFNAQSIDPTQLIQIGNNNNTTPFNGSKQ